MLRSEWKGMKLVNARVGLCVFMLLSGGQAAAAPRIEYLIADFPETIAGVPNSRRAWELRDSISPFFNYRIAANDQAGFRRKHEQWVVHNLTADTHGGSLLLDWHPLGGRFRFSGGLFTFKQSLDYIVAPDVNETLEYEIKLDPEQIVEDLAEGLRDKGISVDVNTLLSYLPEDMEAQSVSVSRHIEFGAQDLIAYAQLKYETLAPYVGFGWSSHFYSLKRLRYSFDLGVLYQDNPDIELVVQGQALQEADPALRAWMDEWIIEQRLDLYRKLEQNSPMPRLAFGLSYSLD